MILLPPIVERELRVALRKRKPAKLRLQAAAIGLGIAGVFMLVGLLGSSNSWGRSLHQYLFLAGLFFAVVRPAQACLGLFSEERRNQTLELLYLAGMNSLELFGGKLLGGWLIASCDLLALMPFLALPFLSGGVSLDLFLATLVCLPLLLCLTVALTVLASVVCKDDGAAFVLTLALAGTLSLATPLPYALGKALTGVAPFSAAWLRLSPAYCALLVSTRFSAGTADALEFWPSAGIMALWALLCLGLAGTILARTWRENPDRAPRPWRAAWQSLLRGSPAWRAALRSRVLLANAFQWMVQRERRPVVLAWGSTLAVCLTWLAGCCAWPDYWPSTVNFFLTAILLLIVVDNLELHAVARRIGEDRREGMLELLLTTPLTPADMVAGQLAAIRAQFQPVRRLLLGLCGLMMLGGFPTRTWNVQAVISYLLIWGFLLAWAYRTQGDKTLVTMWVALNTGRPTFAVFRAQGSLGGWSWIWLLFNAKHVFFNWGRKAVHFPTGSTMEMGMVVVVMLFVCLVVLSARQRQSEMSRLLINDMRRIAQEPLPDPHDPRLKEWKDVRQRLPAPA